MISVFMHGRLGNDLWRYAVCRTIAEKNAYSFHIPRRFMGNVLFDCDLGEEKDSTTKIYKEGKGAHFQIQSYDPEIFNIADGTKLDGYFQAENYIIENRANVRNWFTLKYNSGLPKLDNNTCVVNFRGGDFKEIPEVFLPIKYYVDAMNHIKAVSGNVRFIVITDDVGLALQFFPTLEVFHLGVAEDFSIVNKASFLIIANSTFAWWAAWLNDDAKLVLAPKYWLRHNISTGWWSPSDSLTSRFTYVDREGRLFSYAECKKGITDDNYVDYYTQTNPSTKNSSGLRAWVRRMLATK